MSGFDDIDGSPHPLNPPAPFSPSPFWRGGQGVRHTANFIPYTHLLPIPPSPCVSKVEHPAEVGVEVGFADDAVVAVVGREA